MDHHACGIVERDTNHASCNDKVQLVTRMKVMSQLSSSVLGLRNLGGK